MPDLPPPKHNQPFCTVSALEAGHMELKDSMFLSTAQSSDSVTFAPSLSFLIQHSETKKKLLFDLGISRNWEESLPPAAIARIKQHFPVNIPQTAVESLAKGGLAPDDIDTICLSHCHWDHVGNADKFEKSQFVVGGESRNLFKPGFPEDPSSLFHMDLLPSGRTSYIEADEWTPVGPFPRAFDLYNDGSVYVIDAPGHLAGHANLLVRTSADGAWIFLAGDSAHHWDLLTGVAGVAFGENWCAHVHRGQAETQIARIKELRNMPRVRVVLAHDAPWYSENKGGSAFFPGAIPSL